MYCIKCGFKNEDDAMFCANCGSVMTKKVNNDVMQQVVNAETEEPVKMNSEEVTESVKTIEEVEVTTPEQDTADVQMETVQNIVEVEPQAEPAVGTKTVNQPVNIQKEEPVQPQNATNTMNNANIPVDLYRSPYTDSNTRNPYRKKRFSVPRFIFSMIIMLATICSIVTIAFNYIEINMDMEVMGYSDTYSKEIKGFNIIKENIEIDDIEDFFDIEVDSKAWSDSVNTFRYFIIAFAVVMLVFCVIDFIMLSLVRNKVAYLLTMLFAIIKAALGGIAIYLWTVDTLEEFKKVMEMAMEEYSSYGFAINLEFVPAVGLILALAMQAVIFISAVVLLCTKPKYIDVTPQTIQA